jgi:N utilization substance protein B
MEDTGNKGAISRRAERILAFQVLYGLHFTDVGNREELLRLFAWAPPPDEEPRAPEQHPPARTPPPDGAPRAPEQHPFAWSLVEGTWAHLQDLDNLIARFSRNWRMDRMGRIELTLLRLAMFELICCPDVPSKVVLNEAIELMGKFGDVKSKHFVNGILNAAAREVTEGVLDGKALREADAHELK